ncbi:2,4-dienoyl-CoA reductase-like NADH-dependent reductase (Old Yellow Enzyme family) [Halanaerobium saccharolyticum]|uniref:2,4-dienoyl-CoA reductase-like NADH-dependent reductase (Old Yellow Enzyme family) n=1 Tax=Halanaerobium saccharolyticum TaxID=43595 RepID=A0A4R7Z8P4_9FIRM|nr:NAD(P)/FAD-dependent oxidoreductase [Halanaerobium saccharolyticum]RAK11776.1 2,4-dienoyl-CoA reductase-like NADH-dependent reductase (Old Yellow Enzyme family) [Halanaerobium saccharolyticum]TDW07617.1 2,4-dienoyl-CoA reductase-like NADH-dependent reductase (Old Yellow Enzyme family) [Halanaerobium saccharolyticum]TDX64538.1 2,4-dienoyl-CoA reductase-like NADH-dependent reductase (Old Yellow Enzyme family) [Halanaerobium saccharolyticum]
MNYDVLFSPFKIGNMEVKNRIVMSPMGTNSARIDGTIADDEIDYFEARAKGGTGMIIMGCQFISKEMAQGSLEGVLEKSHVIPQLTTLCEAVHRYDCKITAQLSCGTGRNAFPNMHGEPPMSASAIPSTFNPDVDCRPMSYDDIQEMMDKFAHSAKIVKDAGFDAIEIHGHAGYLIDQFMSPVWNKRTDEYGGSPEKRARFPREIIRSIREAVGEEMPILFRISLDHRFEGGRTLEESMKLIKLLEAEGIDAIDIDAGCYETIDYIFPPAYLGDACMDYVCEPAREAVDIPILNSGNHTPETAVNLLESGNADFVMFGRPLIAEPELANKLAENKREEVRPCIRCNQECIGRIAGRLTKLSCAVNSQACEEKRFEIKKTDAPQNVVIIGAGPAGLEAARTAALSGHQVNIYEKEDQIGGQLAAAATPEFKKQLKELIDWYELQLEQLDIKLNLNNEITSDSPILSEADKIIVAAGAVPIEVEIEGIENSNVINVLTAHQDKGQIKGNDIVICGGGLSGCDNALELAAEENKNVTIVEMQSELAPEMLFINKASLMRKLAENNVKILTDTRVMAFSENQVKIEKADESIDKIKADTIITAFGMKSNNKLADKIKDKFNLKTRVIGDNNQVAKVGGAIRDGFYAGSSIV